MEKIQVKTNSRIELVEITALVQAIVTKSKTKNGICFLFCPHTTAGLTINEAADPAVPQDIKNTMGELIPSRGDYLHSEGNSDSHIRSSLFGFSLQVFVEDSRLMLGAWQGIFFCENDGPRSRQVWVKVV